jgi:DNA-binding NarL/FixJ family response regulator
VAGAAKEAPEPGSLDEFARVAVLFMRYQGAPQRVLIHDLLKLGLQPARIAELLGTTSGTVRNEKREKRPGWPPKPGIDSAA